VKNIFRNATIEVKKKTYGRKNPRSHWAICSGGAAPTFRTKKKKKKHREESRVQLVKGGRTGERNPGNQVKVKITGFVQRGKSRGIADEKTLECGTKQPIQEGAEKALS